MLNLLTNLFEKLENEEPIYEHILWIFANLCLKKDLARIIFKNQKFSKNIFDRFLHKPIFLFELKVTFTWLIGNLLRYDILFPEVIAFH